MSEADGDTAIWRPLRSIDPLRLRKARLQAHFAAQWLARVARGYITVQPDDNHTNLGWRDDEFSTHVLPDDTQVRLNIRELSLDLHNKAFVQHFALNGHNDADVRQWLGDEIAKRGFEAGQLDLPSPYEMPGHQLANGGRYDTTDLSEALIELAAWFSNAQSSIERVRRTMLQRTLNASETRCWPHHFDLATLASCPIAGGQTGYVGAGLSPGDHYYDEPYFYVSIYPRPEPAKLPALPELGHWHTHEFTAAVTTASQILAVQDRRTATDGFLDAAVHHAITLLTQPA